MRENYAQRYEELYRAHWWWRSRRLILLEILAKHLPEGRPDILDVGCGNGLFFPDLAEFGHVQGIEIEEGLISPDNPWRNRIHTMPLGHPAYRDLTFDLITALDVIEHFANDAEATNHMFDMLKPGGILIVMVPALRCLWDDHDEQNQHYRRYNASGLRNLLEGRGDILLLQYLYHWLMPLKLAFKKVNRLAGGGLPQHAIPPLPVNAAMTWFSLLEYRILRPLRLPFGSSLLAVVRKVPNRL